jgi:hypothetical protein
MSRSHRQVLISLAILSIGSLTRPAWALWPHDPGANVALCTATGIQSTPAIVSDGAGGSDRHLG